ncbi:MAG: hypothetical protein WED34_04270 [Planctomycetales bacterium]
MPDTPEKAPPEGRQAERGPHSLPDAAEGGGKGNTPPGENGHATERPSARFGPGQPAHYCGKTGRSGGKPGVPATHGLDVNRRYGLQGGKLPKGCQYIENRVNILRRQVEEAVLERKGEITFVDAANVNSILKWERHGLLANHWLRKEAEKLSPTERLKFSEAIAKASDARDRAIRALGLDVPPEPIDLRTYLNASSTDPTSDLGDK